jgi:hypothetical protein
MTIEYNHINWNFVKNIRNNDLSYTDYYFLIDKYNLLTSEQQTELSNFRQTLRDLPATYEDAVEAWSNYPQMPSFVILPE